MAEKIKKNTEVTPEMVEKAILPAGEIIVPSNNALSEQMGQRIYIGPNTPQLISYTVVKGEFPLHINDLIKKCPSVEKLFVPVSELAVSEPRTKTKGTMEHRHYMKIIDYINGKKGE